MRREMKNHYIIIKPRSTAGTANNDPAVYPKVPPLGCSKRLVGMMARKCPLCVCPISERQDTIRLVVGAYVPDYMNGVIKKRGATRRDKEEDRMKHVRE